MKTAIVSVMALALMSLVRADDEKAGSPDESAYEMDRPGEVENPFTLPRDRAEAVTYLVGMNASAREDAFGDGGAAVILDTSVRIGLLSRLEGVVTIDTFLHSDPLEGATGAATAGLGYATIATKWNFLRDATGDFGVALAPFVRVPLEHSIAGSSRSESGLIVPFDLDLEGGWELQGSSGLARAPQASGQWDTTWENQVSIERTLAGRLTPYGELELETGDGQPAWGIEFGLTWRLNSAVLLDVGESLGVGRNSHGRMTYAGVGWGF